MPLKIIVVGAGVAGLCAGLALRQAGQEVEIFEKSKFATEIGAALIITPNGTRVLSRLGFSFSNARAVKIESWSTLHGDTMEQIARVDLTGAEKTFGFPAWAVHRVSLHNELLRLATSTTETGTPIKIHLASEVSNASPNEGSITLLNGTKHVADLVVAADGLHSVLKRAVAKGQNTAPASTGLSAFRFLIDTDVLEKDEILSLTLQKKGPGATLLADTKDITNERHVMWYPCEDGRVQNFVGIHPRTQTDEDEENPESMKDLMLEEFNHFSPDVTQIIAKSSHVKCWPLLAHDPLQSWTNGRMILIGDAAHPMLPFGGQGSNQAIEDGGALGFVFKGIDSAVDIPKRLELFEKARRDRASRVQILSKVRAGKEKEIEDELRRYADPLGSPVPTTMQERTAHDYRFDVFEKCRQVLRSENNEVGDNSMCV